MSLYNMVNGFNPACVFVLPMLGRKASEYPRFRDCYITDDNNIAVYTRVGGNNRNDGFGEEVLYEDENFIKTYDDEFDSTYGIYEFKVPEKWKEDFDKIINGNLSEISEDYRNVLKEAYPDLAKEGMFDFNQTDVSESEEGEPSNV